MFERRKMRRLRREIAWNRELEAMLPEGSDARRNLERRGRWLIERYGAVVDRYVGRETRGDD